MTPPAAPRPLDGMRVLDFTANVAGPLAAQVMVELGAEVIKVEPPEGEAARRITSSYAGETEHAPYFIPNNRGKRSVVLDLHAPEGVAGVLDLAATADVLIEGFRPGTMRRWGLGPDAVAARNPRCVYASIAAFGGSGPDAARAGVDLVLQAESGMMASVKGPDGAPRTIPFQLVDGCAGHVLAQAVLAALLQRERHGVVERVQVAMYDVAISLQANRITTALHRRDHGEPPPVTGMPFATSPSGILPTADGRWLMFAAYVPKHWLALCRLIGRDDLPADPRFATQAARGVHHAELIGLLRGVVVTRPLAEWLADLRGLGLMAAPVNDWSDVVASATFADSGVEVGTSSAGRPVRTVRPPARYSSFGPRDGLPLPDLGG